MKRLFLLIALSCSVGFGPHGEAQQQICTSGKCQMPASISPTGQYIQGVVVNDAGYGANDSLPVCREAAQSQPACAPTIYAQPVYSQTVCSQPVCSQPVNSQPVCSQQTYSPPAYYQHVYSQPVCSQRCCAQPVCSTPVYSTCTTSYVGCNSQVYYPPVYGTPCNATTTCSPYANSNQFAGCSNGCDMNCANGTYASYQSAVVSTGTPAYTTASASTGISTSDLAQQKAQQAAQVNFRGHLGGSSGNARFEGVGWSNRSPEAAIQQSCYWGQRTPAQIGVARGSDGCWYACVLYY